MENTMKNQQKTQPQLEELTRQLADPETPFGMFMQRARLLEEMPEGETKKALYQHAIYDLMGAADSAESKGNNYQAEFAKKLAETYAEKAGLEPADLSAVYQSAKPSYTR